MSFGGAIAFLLGRRHLRAAHLCGPEAFKVGVQVIVEPGRKTLAVSAAGYIRDAELRGAMEAAAQARVVTEEFRRAVGKTFVDEITRDDILRYHNWRRKQNYEDRTVANKHNRAKSWLLFAGIDRKILPPTPKYEKKLPTMYSTDEIKAILDAADDYMRLAILVAMKCGLSDQELMHLERSDINWERRVIRICGKPKFGSKVEDSKQRDIPVPKDLLEELRERQKVHGKESLVLPRRDGNPNTKLLRMLKRTARRAGLNCERCHSCEYYRECDNWDLHKFRRTFATNMLRNGFDLRTVQAWMGHADLESTMRYLTPASADEVQAKIDKVKW